MTKHFSEYEANPPANYERFFVPAIGAPLAEDIVQFAGLQKDERVLDVACGTGIVARLAAQEVGDTVVGLDINPGMLAVARSTTSDIDWHEAGAENMPFSDETFDVVLCQMGLQFMPDKQSALQEMGRVLKQGGRLVMNMPGPTPQLFTIMEEALERHISAEAAGFVDQVFSLHDMEEIENLISEAGFRDVSVKSDTKFLRLPQDFFWQYVFSTPLAGTVAQMDEQGREALEQDVLAKWQEFVNEGALEIEVRMLTASGLK